MESKYAEALPAPLVAAVSPMTEVQTLDQASAFQKRRETAIALAGALEQAGLSVSAGIFAQWARQKESQAATVTPDPTVSSYSMGDQFGYQVGPSFRAVSQDGKKGSENRLSRFSFPVLLIFGMDKSQVHPWLVYDDVDQTIWVKEPVLSFYQTPQWVPLKGNLKSHMLKTSELTRWSLDLASLEAEPVTNTKDETVNYDNTERMLKVHLDENKNMLNGYWVQVPFPKDLFVTPGAPKPLISASHVFPPAVKLKIDPANKPVPQDVTFTIFGGNLDKVDEIKLLYPDLVISVDQDKKDWMRKVTCKVTDGKTPLAFVLIPDMTEAGNKTPVLVPPISVSVATPKATPPRPQNPDVIFTKRTTETIKTVPQKSTTTEGSVRLKAGTGNDLLEEAIKLIKD